MRHRHCRLICGIVMAVISLATSAALPATIAFSDRGAWETAIGGETSTITFDDLTYNSSGWWFGESFTTGSTTFSDPGGDLYVLAGDFSPEYWQRTSPYLLWNLILDEVGLHGLTLFVEAQTAVVAAGWDFATLDGSITNFLFQVGGETFATQSAHNAYAFFGIVSDTPFTSVSLYSTVTLGEVDIFGAGTIDNFSTAPSIAPVPEPATAVLLLIGVAVPLLVRTKSFSA